MGSVRLMVFDVAGTTVNDSDNAVARCVCEAVRAAGAAVELADVNPVMGMPKPLAVRTLLAQARGTEPAADEVTHVHADFQSRMIQHYRTSPTVRPIDGAERVFEGLRARGIKIGLDTGFDRPILDTILNRLGWTDGIIDDSVTSDEVENGRPAPDMIHALMASAGISDPAEVGKIGDSVSDIEQGLNATCGLVVAVHGQRTTPILSDYPGVQALTYLDELLDMIDAHAAAEAGA